MIVGKIFSKKTGLCTYWYKRFTIIWPDTKSSIKWEETSIKPSLTINSHLSTNLYNDSNKAKNNSKNKSHNLSITTKNKRIISIKPKNKTNFLQEEERNNQKRINSKYKINISKKVNPAKKLYMKTLSK